MDSHVANLARHLKKDDVLTIEKDENNDLYFVFTGKLMVCIRNGTQVTPLAYIGPGEFIGELSFFDGLARSADIIALEDCSLIEIPPEYLKKQFPQWLVVVAKYMTKRMRLMDDVIRKKGVKKKNAHSIQPLTIEEQRYYLAKIKNFSPK
ncbi:MAG: Crp/Fnr family transcriptional regulator [Bacteriovoracaceae bacterium]